MIDLNDYEENKSQRCFDKWMKIPPVQNALTKLDNTNQAMEVAVKLEENRVYFLKDGNDKYLDNVLAFITSQVG